MPKLLIYCLTLFLSYSCYSDKVKEKLDFGYYTLLDEQNNIPIPLDLLDFSSSPSLSLKANIILNDTLFISPNSHTHFYLRLHYPKADIENDTLVFSTTIKNETVYFQNLNNNKELPGKFKLIEYSSSINPNFLAYEAKGGSINYGIYNNQIYFDTGIRFKKNYIGTFNTLDSLLIPQFLNRLMRFKRDTLFLKAKYDSGESNLITYDSIYNYAGGIVNLQNSLFDYLMSRPNNSKNTEIISSSVNFSFAKFHIGKIKVWESPLEGPTD